jgi:hypothetical protein
MCRRSCRRGHGSPPGRAVRLTPPTLIQWRWRVPTCVRLRPVVNNEQLAPLSGPGRPAPVARRGPHLHGRPVAPAAARAHPGRSEEESVRRQAMTLLATVRPRDAVGKARCRVAAGLIADLERDLPAIQGGRQGAQATGCRDREQADGAARLLVEAGDIARFPSRAHFASWNGTCRGRRRRRSCSERWICSTLPRHARMIVGAGGCAAGSAGWCGCGDDGQDRDRPGGSGGALVADQPLEV